MEHVKDVDQNAFQTEVVERSHDVPVVVDFWAEWCGPCRVLSPTLERLAADHGGAFELAKVDVDRNQMLSAQFGVQGIPTVVGFRDGQPVARFTGALPEQGVREWLTNLLPSQADRIVEAGRDAVLSGDEAGAEELFRSALAEEARHQEAGTSLAALLLSQDRNEEALAVLELLSPTPEVQKLLATARLAKSTGADVAALKAAVDADPDDQDARLGLAGALAANHEFEPALDHLLDIVRRRGERTEDARRAMVDVFEVIGNDHPLTATYRRELANALF